MGEGSKASGRVPFVVELTVVFGSFLLVSCAADASEEPEPVSSALVEAVCDDLGAAIAAEPGSAERLMSHRDAKVEIRNDPRVEEAVRGTCGELLREADDAARADRRDAEAERRERHQEAEARRERRQDRESSAEEGEFYVMLAAWQTLSAGAQADICREVSKGMTEAVAAGRHLSDATEGLVSATEGAAFLRTVC